MPKLIIWLFSVLMVICPVSAELPEYDQWGLTKWQWSSENIESLLAQSDTEYRRNDLEKAAATGDGKAMVLLASGHLLGKFGKPDLALARDWATQAIAAGQPRGNGVIVSILLRDTMTPQTGVEAIRLANAMIAGGAPIGHYTLFVIYLGGLGVPVDVAKAVTELQIAAKAGVRIAMVPLAKYYWHGQYLPQDRVESVKWMQKAQDYGDQEAEAMLKMADVRAEIDNQAQQALALLREEQSRREAARLAAVERQQRAIGAPTAADVAALIASSIKVADAALGLKLGIEKDTLIWDKLLKKRVFFTIYIGNIFCVRNSISKFDCEFKFDIGSQTNSDNVTNPITNKIGEAAERFFGYKDGDLELETLIGSNDFLPRSVGKRLKYGFNRTARGWTSDISFEILMSGKRCPPGTTTIDGLCQKRSAR